MLSYQWGGLSKRVVDGATIAYKVKLDLKYKMKLILILLVSWFRKVRCAVLESGLLD